VAVEAPNQEDSQMPDVSGFPKLETRDYSENPSNDSSLRLNRTAEDGVE
jgi:hypothetical protein